MREDSRSQRRFLIGIIVLGSFWAGPSSGEDGGPDNQLKFHVVGYLPDYRIDKFDPRVCQDLTDLVLFSISAEPNGSLTSSLLESHQTKSLLKRIRADYKTRVQICVGGWGRSKGFPEVAATADSRRLFATNLSGVCRLHGLDGADIDWEHPENDEQATNYGLLLAEIAKQFKPHKLQLTVAMASWQRMTPLAIESANAFHLMSYDASGRHSTLEAAKGDVQKLLDMGVPPEKIRLGLPFYGRGIAKADQVKTYAEIIAAQPKPADLGKVDQDEIDGIYFNGPSTIQSKARFAAEHKLSGVMIWELGQDAPGDRSLLKVISTTVKGGTR